MLEQFLVSQLFAFLMAFCRIGSAIMILPGIGESYVSPRIRLMLALGISLLLTPVLEPLMPPVPGNPLSLFLLLIIEIIAGSFIGMVCRFLISVMHVAGMIMAAQSSLATATMFDINQASQGTAFGNFLSVTAIIILFASNLHHVALRGVVDSYTLFPVGVMPLVGDIAKYYGLLLSQCFDMAIRISAPLMIAGFIVNLGAGILSRLMPTMQVFFIMMPAQILISFFMLASVFGAIMLWYMNFYADMLGAFLKPGGML